MRKERFTFFNEDYLVPLVTYNAQSGQKETPPNPKWDCELIIRKPEDWYALDFFRRQGVQSVFVVDASSRDRWIKL